ncbi:MAG: Gfo/Idh/MocA family oxidoreductase [Acidobacteriota bacterium]|jgi:predicted dehydrogenase
MSLKVIIVGAGTAGCELHLNACRQIGDVDVIALCDSDLDKAASMAEQQKVPRYYSSLNDALDAHSTDIVSICTPPSSHFELCKLALERGCHVLVEKPIFQSLEEAHEVREIIGRTECKFSAVHSQKYLPGIQQAVKLVNGASIGEVMHVHAVRMINGDKDRLVCPDCWCNELPGGRWEELIPHLIYKAYQFMGPLKFVHLEMKKVHNHWPWLPADELEIILEGGLGYVTVSLSSNADNYNHILVYGSKRILFIDNYSAAAVDLLSRMRLPDAVPPLRGRLKGWLFGRQTPSAKPYPVNPHSELIKDFVSYVKGTRDAPPVDWQEAFNVLEVGLRVGEEIASRKATHQLY